MDGKAEEPGAGRIVVVNDDTVQLAVIAGLLRKGGHSVLPCGGVEDAFNAMGGNPPPDLIVTDLHMPEIDGWRFCRLLRSPEHPTFNETPILVVSATYSGDESRRITAELGANAFLPAPVEPARLYEHVRALLAGETPQVRARILIVDDSRAVRGMLDEAFVRHGYETATAGTGAEGREMLRDFLPDSAIFDYHLPDMNGDALLEEVRRAKPQCAPLMITTDPDPHLAVKWMSMGAAAYVRKPFDPEYVVRLSESVRRERSLLFVEDHLEARTRELRDSEARYRTLFAEVTDALIVHRMAGGRLSGKILDVNDVACNLLGFTHDEVTGMSMGEVTVPAGDEDARRTVNDLRAGKGVMFEQEYVARNGRHVPVEVHARVFKHHGEPAVMVLARDITDRKRTEAERRRREKRVHQDRKFESLRVMAGSIAHRFNNLLTALQGNLELASMELKPGSKALLRLQEAGKATEQAAVLSRGMLTYVGQIQVDAEALDMGEVVGDLLGVVESTLPGAIRVTFERPSEAAWFRGDRALVQQVLASLLQNSIEAMEESGGEIAVTCGKRFFDKAHLQRFVSEGELTEGELVFVTVADTGPGMDHETLGRVFDPFFSTKFAGRGLELAAACGIVRSHHGGLAVSSQPGEGAAFTVLFPPCPGERQ